MKEAKRGTGSEGVAPQAKFSRRKGFAVVRGSRIMNNVGGLGDCEEMRRLDHPLRDAAAELLDLAADVLEEGVAAPPSDQHDRVDGNLVQIHCHSRSAPKGVRADLVRGVSEAVLSHRRRDRAKLHADR